MTLAHLENLERMSAIIDLRDERIATLAACVNRLRKAAKLVIQLQSEYGTPNGQQLKQSIAINDAIKALDEALSHKDSEERG